MNSYKIDKEKATRLAKELGIEVFFGNEQTGVFWENGKRHCSFKDLFPELSLLSEEDTFILKEEDNLEKIASKMVYEKHAELIEIGILDEKRGIFHDVLYNAA